MEINKIYYNKCENLLPQVPEDFIDLVVTSPPYADATNYGKEVNIFSPENYVEWFLPISKEIYRVLKPTGSFILNINDRIHKLERSTYVFNLIHRIVTETELKLYDRYIWYKKSGLPTGGQQFRPFDRIEYLFHFAKDVKAVKNYPDRIREPYARGTLNRMKYDVGMHDKIDENGITTTKKRKIKPNPLGKMPDNVFRFPTAGTIRNNGLHPASFHTDLPTYFINWLTDENDVVLDPFMGSGTTAISCIMTNRKYIGFEKNIKYKEIVERRLYEYDKRPDNVKKLFSF